MTKPFDSNRALSPEGPENQGRQAGGQGDKSPSPSPKTSQQRLDRHMRLLRSVPESSAQQVDSESSASHLETPQHVQGYPEQQAVLRQKKRKYEWKKPENKDMNREKMKNMMEEKWKDPTFRAMQRERMKKTTEENLEKRLNKKYKGNKSKIEAFKRIKDKKRNFEMQWEQEEKKDKPRT